MITLIVIIVTASWALTLALGPSVRVVWRRRRELHSWWYAGRPQG